MISDNGDSEYKNNVVSITKTSDMLLGEKRDLNINIISQQMTGELH